MKQKLLSATAIVVCALFFSQKAVAQWSVTGNAATDTAINFIGTTDSKGLKIKTNNQTRMYVDKGGKIGIGTLSPQTALDLYSASVAIAFGIRSDAGSSFIFMDKQNPANDATVSYRTDGTAIWQTGTFGNNDFAIKNLGVGSAITCLQLNNNVGIGITTPDARLHVAGSIKIADGSQGTGKVLTSDINGLASWQTPTAGAETDPEVSSAITNLVAKWNGTTLVDGIIYDSGTNVGIGTTVPVAKLDVKTTSSYVAQFNGASPMYMGIFENDTYRGYWGSYSGAAEDVDFGTGAGTTGKLHLTIQATPRLTIDNAGNVGIDVTSPVNKLDIEGGVAIGANYSGTEVAATNGLLVEGATAIGLDSAAAKLHVKGIGSSSITAALFVQNSSNDTLMRIRNDGRMSIGYSGTTYGRTLNMQGTGINFYASLNGFGGAVFPTDTSLVIWSNSGANNNLILQPSWGSVGIGTYGPKARLHVATGAAASLSTGGFIVAGLTTGTNLAIDPNQIVARNNGLASPLFLNNLSGNVLINAQGTGTMGVGTHAPSSLFRANVLDSSKAALLIGNIVSGALASYLTINIPTTSSALEALRIRDDNTTFVTFYKIANAFQLQITGDALASGGVWTNSDKRIKSDIKDISNALPELLKLRPTTYHFNNQSESYKYLNLPDELQFGLIAQEVKEVFPNIVREQVQLDEEGKQRPTTVHSLNYTALIPVIIKGMQEQQKQIEEKDLQVAELMKQVAELKSVVNSCCEATEASHNKASQPLEATDSKLFQNQPNPFNQSTVIRYELSNNFSGSQIIIRDLNGNLVKSIAISNSGKGQVTVNANELTAGTYTYTLVVGGESVDTKLMVVTK